MKWIETVKRVYNERGYLVIACLGSKRLGDIVTTVNLYDTPAQQLPQPFRVVSETTVEDYKAQHQLAKTPYGPEYEEPHRFYRIMTD